MRTASQDRASSTAVLLRPGEGCGGLRSQGAQSTPAEQGGRPAIRRRGHAWPDRYRPWPGWKRGGVEARCERRAAQLDERRTDGARRKTKRACITAGPWNSMVAGDGIEPPTRGFSTVNTTKRMAPGREVIGLAQGLLGHLPAPDGTERHGLPLPKCYPKNLRDRSRRTFVEQGTKNGGWRKGFRPSVVGSTCWVPPMTTN